MRFYPKDQGLTSFLSELWASRRAAATPPPINRQGDGRAGAGIPSSPPPIPPQTFSAEQQKMNIKEMALKAAHPYQPPIAGKWQEEWLERYTKLVREACFDECARIAEGNYSRDGIHQGELTAQAIRAMK